MGTPNDRVKRHLYAISLSKYAAAYRLASGAVGLRKDCARYLASEADRLDSEARLNHEYADRDHSMMIANDTVD